MDCYERLRALPRTPAGRAFPGPGRPVRVEAAPAPARRPWWSRLGFPSRAWAWGLLALTGVWVAASFLLHEPCLGHTWRDGFQYAHRCYTDVQPLYGSLGLDQGHVPYVGRGGARLEDGDLPAGFNPYPVVTGLLMWVEARLVPSRAAFVVLNAVVMGVCAAGVTLLLPRFGRPPRRLLWWALGPPLVLYAVYNWDLLTVLLATAGLLAFHKDRLGLSGLLLGLGFCAKFYPGLFLPVLGCELLRREKGLGPRGWSFGLFAVGAIVAVNAPFALWNLVHPNPDPDNPNVWLATFRYHAFRGSNAETPWFVVGRSLIDGGHPAWGAFVMDQLPKVGALALIGLLAWTCWRVWKGGLDWLVASFAALLAFLVLNKVFSLQYALWVLPFLAVVRLPWPAKAAFLLGDLLVWTALWPYLFASRTDPDASIGLLTVAVLARSAALVALLVLTLRSPSGQLEGQGDPMQVPRGTRDDGTPTLDPLSAS